jgi:hypothetical protein
MYTDPREEDAEAVLKSEMMDWRNASGRRKTNN